MLADTVVFIAIVDVNEKIIDSHESLIDVANECDWPVGRVNCGITLSVCIHRMQSILDKLQIAYKSRSTAQ